jgi:hypothetical protein
LRVKQRIFNKEILNFFTDLTNALLQSMEGIFFQNEKIFFLFQFYKEKNKAGLKLRIAEIFLNSEKFFTIKTLFKK